jgi:hypothetical protein
MKTKYKERRAAKHAAAKENRVTTFEAALAHKSFKRYLDGAIKSANEGNEEGWAPTLFVIGPDGMKVAILSGFTNTKVEKSIEMAVLKGFKVLALRESWVTANLDVPLIKSPVRQSACSVTAYELRNGNVSVVQEFCTLYVGGRSILPDGSTIEAGPGRAGAAAGK